MKTNKRSVVVGLLAFLALILMPVAAYAKDSQNPGFQGDGTAEKPWLIQNAADLKKLSDTVKNGVTFSGNYFKVTEDIDLSGGTSWTPIGSRNALFAGVFDGDNHTVTGLYINRNTEAQGLFGHTAGTVKNLSVSGTVSGGANTGGIAGLNSGIITNASFSGTVTGKGSSYRAARTRQKRFWGWP